MLARGIARVVDAVSRLCLAAGIGILVVESVWITYGVFVRYVLGRPDRIVTEATALLLVPLAFLGLPVALRQDSFPRVDFLAQALAPTGRRLLNRFNAAVGIAVVGFFAIVAINAARSTFVSGASSQVLNWPEYLFWSPVAFAAVVFVLEGIGMLFGSDER